MTIELFYKRCVYRSCRYQLGRELRAKGVYIPFQVTEARQSLLMRSMIKTSDPLGTTTRCEYFSSLHDCKDDNANRSVNRLSHHNSVLVDPQWDYCVTRVTSPASRADLPGVQNPFIVVSTFSV